MSAQSGEKADDFCECFIWLQNRGLLWDTAKYTSFDSKSYF